MRRMSRLLAASLVVLAGSASAKVPPCGDVVPADASVLVVDIGDVVKALRIAVGLEMPTPEQRVAGDVAPTEPVDESTIPPTVTPLPDSVVDVADVVLLLRVATGLVAIDNCGTPTVERVRVAGAWPNPPCGAGLVDIYLWNPDALPLGDFTIDGVPAPVLDEPEPGQRVRLWIDEPPGLPAMGVTRLIRMEGASSDLVLRQMPPCTLGPVVVSMSPSFGSTEGEPGIVTGDNLECHPDVRLVRGDVEMFAQVVRHPSPNELTLHLPEAPDAVGAPWDVVVRTACGEQVLPGAFEYIDPATVDGTSLADTRTGLASGSAIGGSEVRITGTELRAASVIRVAGVRLRPDADYSVTAEGDILVRAMPPSPSGPYVTLAASVVVERDETPLTWTYVGEPLPECHDFGPRDGGAGTAITIEGTGLGTVTGVAFGAEYTEEVFHPVSDGTRLVVVAPQHAPGAATLSLAPSGLTCGGVFTFIEGP